MPDRITFGKEDIGGEVLAILTTGLYRDPLDTLREYIQNAIDAKCGRIEVFIGPDTISVADDGVGMNAEQARRAIRLGISDKNPLERRWSYCLGKLLCILRLHRLPKDCRTTLDRATQS